MWLYSLIFSLLAFWFNFYFLSAFLPIWQINAALVSVLLYSIYRKKLPWLFILATGVWESILIKEASFGSILIGLIILWLGIEILLKILNPVNTPFSAFVYLGASSLLHAVYLKIISFFTPASADLNFLFAALFLNTLLAFLAWIALNKIFKVGKKWLLLKS